LSVKRSFYSGNANYTQELEFTRAVLRQSDVKGHKEIVLAIEIPDSKFNNKKTPSTEIMIRYLLNQDGKGQPVMEQNNFSGTVDPQSLVTGKEDPSQYASGF